VSEEGAILKRLEELESQMAFQDELIGQLNEVVARQDQEISRLKEQVAEMVKRLREMGDSMPGTASGSTDETPPHY
jgi:SlyX protein